MAPSWEDASLTATTVGSTNRTENNLPTRPTCLFVDIGGVILINGWDRHQKHRMISYRDLYLTTAMLERTPIGELPTCHEVTCTRSGGWKPWSTTNVLEGSNLLAD